jgi:linoleoyl-CoA desaturase
MTNPSADLSPHSQPVISPTSPRISAAREIQKTALKFSGSDKFVRELRRRVDAYFEQTGRRRRDCAQMYFKTASILAWFVGAYLLLLFFATSWWTIIPLAIVLGLAIAAIGFNIQHDGGHKAYSDRQWVNRMMALTLDLMGGSSYLWDWKHNSFHHTYPNIDGHDDDIDVGILGRLSPQQRRFKFHRLQGIYLWLLYGFLAIKWHFFDDFYNIAVGRIGGHKIPRPRGKDLMVFIGGKVVFFSIAFVIPMLLHPWWAVLGVYAIAAFVSGVVLSVVFQLAHCVEEAEFPVPVLGPDGGEQMQTDWAVHQVQTTVDFARRNRLLCWFLGGLNFQIEHHLFHKICHIHYPALSKVVEDTCREFGIRYAAHRSFLDAVASHYRWLVIMGRPVNAASKAEKE